MLAYRLIKDDVSESAIQFLSDEHDAVCGDNPKHAFELDRLCGKLKGDEIVEKDGETFMVVCAAAVKEVIGELSDIHDAIVDENPDGAEEIDTTCGELENSLEMPYLPSKALEVVQDTLGDVLDGLRDHLSRILPVSGNTADESQRVAFIGALNKLDRVANGLESSDFVPGGETPEHDFLGASEALIKLSTRNFSS
ncbi:MULTISPECIES: hypothetical protein [Halomonadaceae]|uniref:hypothetical protein n=1 Tax=Halomonadaceae TaxID=28256 RepID=UPI003CFABDCA